MKTSDSHVDAIDSFVQPAAQTAFSRLPHVIYALSKGTRITLCIGQNDGMASSLSAVIYQNLDM